MARYYHPACLLESFSRARAWTIRLTSTADIQDYELLSTEDQALISTLLAEHASDQADDPPDEPLPVQSVPPPARSAAPSKRTAAPAPKPPDYRQKCSKPLKLDSLRVVYTNADQLISKRREELESQAQIIKPHIICVTEVKPKSAKERTILDYQLQGYTAHPVNIQSSDGGRGIIVYTIAALDNHVSLVEVVAANAESCWLAVSLRGSDRLLLGCVYRQQVNNHAELRALLARMTTKKDFSHVAVMGDFNYPGIKWDTCSAPGGDENPAALFIEATRDCFLTQHVLKPTRARGQDQPSLLDLILTNEPGMVSHVEHLAPLDGNDHDVLVFDLQCYVEFPKPKPKFCYDKGDYISANNFLSSCSWGGADVEAAWTKLADNLTSARDQFIPTRTMTGKPSWGNKGSYLVDEETRKLIRKKSSTHNLFMEHRNKPQAEREAYHKAYTRARNHVRTVLRKKRRAYEKDIASQAKTAPKKFFAYCQSKTKTRAGIAPLLRDPDDKASLVSSDAEMSEFCKHSIAVFS